MQRHVNYDQCIQLLKNILGDDLLGVYLYGSAVSGGLQKYSDIDLLVVTDRDTTREEKSLIIRELLTLSGVYMKDVKPPIEMTIVNHDAVNPWQYPPEFDFQYGEWLRDEFAAGNIEPWSTKVMPDLAILITQLLLAHTVLFGKSPNQLLPTIPRQHFIQAIAHSLEELIPNLESDTRNVLLTLARIWNTVETDTILPKPAAAEWAIQQLPENLRVVMQRAKAICVGAQDENWHDVQALLKPCADYMYQHSKLKIASI